MPKTERLIRDLPDPDAARRFLGQLAESHPSQSEKLFKNEGLMSDVLTLVSFSPLLATTLLQNPEYFWWLGRKRLDSVVRGKDELLESLARFALTNSQLELQVLFARFRRRELLRIYLRDIRGLATIAEVTEEISNLADAILESALEHARREMDNRFGQPQETDEKGRKAPSKFCVTAMGKLGSRELNYSSDIDLVFMYSADGSTTGTGSRDAVTNREYFIKLAEFTTKLVGQQIGEGAAYRVDLRLRPHGSLGALTLSVADTVRYYRTEARAWERQVLIRSRGSAGDVELFRQFFAEVEPLIFESGDTIEQALANVRRSKEKIDLENVNRRGFDVKLGRGGIREIEFLAQAIQLAHGGSDKWIRSPHTLISLSRITDRNYLSKTELAELSTAYEFLRRTEHILQMENGNQTHTVTDDAEKRALLARRMSFAAGGDFEKGLAANTANVSRIFRHVFGETITAEVESSLTPELPTAQERTRSHVLASIEKSDVDFEATGKNAEVLDRLTRVSPHFAAMLAANPQLAADLPDPDADFVEPDYAEGMMASFRVTPSGVSSIPNRSPKGDTLTANSNLGRRLAAMRRTWSRYLLQIVVLDIFDKITIDEAKRLQTNLAEASIAAAISVVRDALAEKYHTPIEHLDLAVLALGKLGGRGLDYDSDLDLIIVYFDESGWRRDSSGEVRLADKVTSAEFYSRAVELLSTTLSSMTRDGNLYRVDLRLRPFGSKGLSAISIDAFLGYMKDTAAVWELLAFVKLRAVGGDTSIGRTVENETRRLIHERALAVDPDELRDETRRVRLALEQQRQTARRTSEVDIKYGPGGMLDVYFAMRYLQLRDNIPDEEEGAKRREGVEENDRSTAAMLAKLEQFYSERSDAAESSPSLLLPSFPLPLLSSSPILPALIDLRAGHEFLSALDHNLRLTVGRTTRVPLANHAALTTIAKRMNLASAADLLEQLTLHRLAIRNAFDEILS